MARRPRLQREEVVKITEIAELALATRRRRRQAKLHGFERLVLRGEANCELNMVHRLKVIPFLIEIHGVFGSC